MIWMIVAVMYLLLFVLAVALCATLVDRSEVVEPVALASSGSDQQRTAASTTGQSPA